VVGHEVAPQTTVVKKIGEPELDDLLRRGVDAVDGDVDVAVVGVAVERIDRLVVREAHLGKKHPDRLVRLLPRRLLTLSPAHDPVLHRLRAATGDLGQVDHLLHLAVVFDVEEVGRSQLEHGERGTIVAAAFHLLPR
jgi:hypothetical protein